MYTQLYILCLVIVNVTKCRKNVKFVAMQNLQICSFKLQMHQNSFSAPLGACDAPRTPSQLFPPSTPLASRSRRLRRLGRQLPQT